MEFDATRIRGSSPAADGAEEAQSDAPAIRIDRVELGRRLGQGGMAAVYLGLDTGFSPPRRVAVKLMDPELSEDPEFRQRFELEASLAANFRNDNIVHIYSSGETGDGAKYIVMEYLAGGSLADRIERGPLPVDEALNIAVAMAEALAYAHAGRVVHRDFKPGNILFTAEGRAVLTDFGVAKLKSAEDAGLTRHAMSIGAPRYMAPEQDRGEEVTDRADVYALALTIMEMLTGRALPVRLRTLRGDSGVAELRQLLPPDCPAALAELLCRCLQFDPEQRPEAMEARRQLAALRGADGGIADPHQAGSGAASRRTWLSGGMPWVIGSALLVLLLVGGYVLWQEGSASTEANTSPAGATGAGAAVLPVRRSPPTLRLLVDGTETAGDVLTLAAGTHQLIGLAPGYHGKVWQLTLAPGDNQPLAAELTAQRLPSRAEHNRFLDLNEDNHAMSEADLAAVPEPTLQDALRYKWLQDSGASLQASVLEQQIGALASAGDARAAVTALLIRTLAEPDRLDRGLVKPELQAASEGGDAMASFWLAAALGGELSASVTDAEKNSNPTYRDYCRLLLLSRSQGWADVADEFIRLRGCQLR